MKAYRRFAAVERRDRLVRRSTGPWQTVAREVGPVVITSRYRRRRQPDFALLDVALHDLWTHALMRETLYVFIKVVRVFWRETR